MANDTLPLVSHTERHGRLICTREETGAVRVRVLRVVTPKTSRQRRILSKTWGRQCALSESSFGARGWGKTHRFLLPATTPQCDKMHTKIIPATTPQCDKMHTKILSVTTPQCDKMHTKIISAATPQCDKMHTKIISATTPQCDKMHTKIIPVTTPPCAKSAYTKHAYESVIPRLYILFP